MSKQGEIVNEEGIKIKSYGEDITKKLTVFYNPVMKLNRDISMLVINSYFEDDKCKFCDPMAATGIRELRFLKTIPNKFEKITMGDISKTAIENISKNFELNNISKEKIDLINANAINTITKEFYNFIEIDPFGSPVPFLDSAIQRIKHEGILSITATDTAALCGTYPKKTLRKYGIKVEKILCYEEIGVRNLIAYCIREGAKYDKVLTPIVSISQDHFYKIFFKINESRTKSLEEVKDLKYYKWDKKTQEIKFSDFEKEGFYGKTYIKGLNDKKFIEKMIKSITLIKDNKKILKLLDKIVKEENLFGHYNIHKLEKEFNFSSEIKFDTLIEKLIDKGFLASRPHNNRLCIKTDAKANDIITIMKEYLNN